MKNAGPGLGDELAMAENPYKLLQDKYAEMLKDVRSKVTGKKVMTPDIDKHLSEIEKKAQDILSQSAKVCEEGNKELARAEAELNAGLPDWAKKLLAKAGLDPDDPNPLKQLTREEVIERHARGLSLAGKNMAVGDLIEIVGIVERGR